jgi:hypothetical protein
MAKTAAELAGIDIIHVYSIALERCYSSVSIQLSLIQWLYKD